MHRAMAYAFGLLIATTAVAFSEECTWLGDTVACGGISGQARTRDAIPNVTVKLEPEQPAELIRIDSLAVRPDDAKVVSDIRPARVGTHTSSANPGVGSDGVACTMLADTIVCD